MTSRDLLFKESRALASVAVSENPRLNFEYFKYLGKHRRFGFNASYFKEVIDYPIYNDFDLSETLRSIILTSICDCSIPSIGIPMSA